MARQTLAAARPDLAAQWHPTRNGGLTPDRITNGSGRKAWWRCPTDPSHEWDAAVGNRARLGAGCPFCSGRRPTPDRSLAAGRPDLAAQWHPTKNGALTPHDVSEGSTRGVWWVCPRDRAHAWRATVNSRARGHGCPYCTNKKASATNSLAVRRPDLAALWHPTRNGSLTPADVVAGSARRVWWRCLEDQSHEWEAAIRSRKGGCPICVRRRKPFDPLAPLPPALAAEWHPSRNGLLTATGVLCGSSRPVWWRCPAGPDHEWEASPEARTRLGRRCPMCAAPPGSGASLADRYPDVAAQWHPTLNGPLTPDRVAAHSERRAWWRCSAGPDHEWEAIIKARVRRGPGCPFCAGSRVSVTNALATRHPDLAAQWHPTRNGGLTPAEVVAASGRKVWWRCDRVPRHAWPATIASRAVAGTGCPYCAGRRVEPAASLARLRPELAAEWHPTRNAPLTPARVTLGSNERVWWRCSAAPDHEWQAAVVQRATQGTGCPYCANKRVTSTNSLAALRPDLAAEWHPTRNGPLRPEEVVPGSNRRVWWCCPRGPDHEWSTAVSRRAYAGTGCPFCRGKRVSATNSLASREPGLAAQWHPDRNGDLTPDQVTLRTDRLVWWRCPAGPDHEWAATPANRAGNSGTGCPFCANKRVSVTNSLRTLHPELVAEWHPARNGDLTPDRTVATTQKMAWWYCADHPDHPWQYRVAYRARGWGGCPLCREEERRKQERLRLRLER